MAHGLGVGRHQLRADFGPADDGLIGRRKIAREPVQEPTWVSTWVIGQPHRRSK
jgi:hypothetical protein